MTTSWWITGWRRWVLGFIVISTLAVLVLRLLVMTPIGHSLAVRQIEQMRVQGQSINVSGVRGDLLGRFELETLRVADSDGMWFEAQDVEVRWSPMRFLFGSLEVNDFRIGEAQLDRRPILSPNRNATSSSNSNSAPRLLLERGAIQRLAIAEGVLGRSQVVHVEGALILLDEDRSIELSVEPLIEKSDSIDISVNWAPNTYPSGALKIAAQAGGFLATALGTPDGADLTGQFEAVALNQTWKLEGSLLAGGTEVLRLDGLAGADNVQAALWLDASKFASLTPATDLLGPELHVDVTADPSRELVPIQFETRADDVSLDGRLDWDRSAPALLLSNIDTTLKAGGIVKRANDGSDLMIDPLEIEGDFSLGGGGWSFDGGLQTNRLIASGQTLSGIEIDADIQSRGSSIALIAQTNIAEVEALGGGPADLTVNAAYDLETAIVSISALRILASGLDVVGAGDVGLDSAVDLAGTMTLVDTGPIASGDFTWAATGTAQDRYSGTVDGEFVPIGLNEEFAEIVGTAVSAKANISRPVGDGIRLDMLQLEGAKFGINASGDQSGLEGRIRLDPLATKTVSTGGGEGEFEVSLPGEGIGAALDLELTSFSWQNQHFSEPRLSVDLRQNDAVDINANLMATFNESPLNLVANGAWTDDSLVFPDIRLSAHQFNASATIDVPVSNLAAAKAEVQFEGDVTPTFSLSGAGQLESGVFELSALSQGSPFSHMEIGHAVLSASGDTEVIDVGVEFVGTVAPSGLPVELDGRSDAVIHVEDRAGSLTLDWTVDGQSLKSQSPIEFEFSEIPKLSADLAVFGGALNADLRSDNASNAIISITNIDIAPIARMLGRPDLAARVDGAVDIAESAGTLNGDAELNFRDLRVIQSGLPAVRARLVATIVENSISTRFNLVDVEQNLEIDGAADLQLWAVDQSLAYTLATEAPIFVALTGSGDISALWGLVGPPDVSLDGQINLDLSGQGLIETISLTGPVTLRDGVFEDAQTGLALKDINLDASAAQNGVTVDRLQAAGWNRGTLSGRGAIRYDRSLDLQITLSELDALNRDDLSATLSGPVSVIRSEGQTNITGNLVLDRARLDLSQLPQGSYQTLDVSFDVDPSEEDDAAQLEGVRIDLWVTAERRVFVTSPQLESEWSLELDVDGTPSDIRLLGSANLVRGSAELLTSSFRLRDGVLRFNGGIDTAEVDLLAVQNSGGFETQVRLIGDLVSPSFDLSSSPSLPEEEILSRILFGRSPGDLSGFETAQLAAAVASLASGGSGLDIMGSFRDATGLDRVAIGQNADGGAALTTGKYLADDVYLEIETGASGTPALELEWTPLDNLQLDTQFDPDLGPRIGLQWRRDFDRLSPFDDASSDAD